MNLKNKIIAISTSTIIIFPIAGGVFSTNYIFANDKDIYEPFSKNISVLKTDDKEKIPMPRAVVNPGSMNWKYKTTKYTKDYGAVSVNALSQFLFAAASGWGLGKIFTKAVANSVAGGIFSFVKAPSLKVVYYKVFQYTATDHTKRIYNRFDITAYKHSDYTGKLTSYSRVVYP